MVNGDVVVCAVVLRHARIFNFDEYQYIIWQKATFLTISVVQLKTISPLCTSYILPKVVGKIYMQKSFLAVNGNKNPAILTKSLVPWNRFML
jgi:hypothetical protein